MSDRAVRISLNSAITSTLVNDRGENTIVNFSSWKRREGFFPMFVGRNRVIDRLKEFSSPIVRNADGTSFFVVNKNVLTSWEIDPTDGVYDILDVTLDRLVIVPKGYKATQKTEPTGSGIVQGFEVTISEATSEDIEFSDSANFKLELAKSSTKEKTAGDNSVKKRGRKSKAVTESAAAAAQSLVDNLHEEETLVTSEEEILVAPEEEIVIEIN